MSDSLQLQRLLERLREDGGRYLLSVAMTDAEIDAQEAPTFGGKAHRRWLTDEEYAALCALATDTPERGEVMNPPASAAQGAEAGNLNRHFHGRPLE
jgi:hypothetical protein